MNDNVLEEQLAELNGKKEKLLSLNEEYDKSMRINRDSKEDFDIECNRNITFLETELYNNQNLGTKIRNIYENMIFDIKSRKRRREDFYEDFNSNMIKERNNNEKKIEEIDFELSKIAK